MSCGTGSESVAHMFCMLLRLHPHLFSAFPPVGALPTGHSATPWRGGSLVVRRVRQSQFLGTMRAGVPSSEVVVSRRQLTTLSYLPHTIVGVSSGFPDRSRSIQPLSGVEHGHAWDDLHTFSLINTGSRMARQVRVSSVHSTTRLLLVTSSAGFLFINEFWSINNTALVNPTGHFLASLGLGLQHGRISMAYR
ncbi:uncharacterized protein B0T15DRAFT_295118 [Chaetomium strumarium]|uniref:Uncharacterized protein n=1 Tax=Chaetomium strumarium TaxID=1170767 RepID=A0AAJ0GM25_9PEZI|nr:hypothetical protein B0T15DRAFT_295118 [Chaetomium strumarium]